MPDPAKATTNASEPKYRHYKPKNLGLVRIDGKDHYLGRYGSPESRERYHRLLTELHGNGTATPTPTPQPTTAEEAPPALSIDELILAFWRHAEVHYRHSDGTPTGEAPYFRDSLRPLRRLYGTTSAEAFTPKSPKMVRKSMIGDNLARSTINQRIGRIVHVFKWAVSEEMIPVAVLSPDPWIPADSPARWAALLTAARADPAQLGDSRQPPISPLFLDIRWLEKIVRDESPRPSSGSVVVKTGLGGIGSILPVFDGPLSIPSGLFGKAFRFESARRFAQGVESLGFLVGFNRPFYAPRRGYPA